MTWLYEVGPVRRRLRMGAFALSALALQMVSSSAAAGEAEDKYDAGVEATAEGDHEAACKRFAESAELDKNARVMIALGDCKEELGKLLDARDHLASALELLDEDDPRRAAVSNRVDVLTRRIPQLIVRLPEDAPEGATVSLDGVKLDVDELGTAIELNPGEHRLAAKAPGEEAADVGVFLHPGDSIEITAVLNPNEKIELVPTPSPKAAPPPAREEGWNPMPLGIAFAAIGASALVATAITGGMYLRDRNIVEEECDDDNLCTLRGLDAAERADIFGKVAMVTGIAGGVLVGTGIAIMIGAAVSTGNDDRGDQASMLVPAISPDQVGLTWVGRF